MMELKLRSLKRWRWEKPRGGFDDDEGTFWDVQSTVDETSRAASGTGRLLGRREGEEGCSRPVLLPPPQHPAPFVGAPKQQWAVGSYQKGKVGRSRVPHLTLPPANPKMNLEGVTHPNAPAAAPSTPVPPL